MSTSLSRFEPSQFVLTSLAKATPNPLDILIADASKRRGSPVYRGAVARFSLFSRTLVDHLTSRSQTREQKVQSLPGVGVTAPHRACDWAVHSVFALAVLVRLDTYIQDELERRNYHRSCYCRTNGDLLEAIHTLVGDDKGLADLIITEAVCFLRVVQNPNALAASITDRLDDFKRLI